MKKFLKEQKYEWVRTFVLDSPFGRFRLNPFSRLSEEEETILLMYIQQEMPYLELEESSDWNGEVLVKHVDYIPAQDQLDMLKRCLDETEEEYYSFRNQISVALGD